MATRKTQAGFTSVELMVGLAISGIVISMIASSLSQVLPRMRARQGAEEVGAALRGARLRAITERADVVMSFDADRGIYEITSRSAPFGTTTEAGFDDRITWLPDGIKFANPDPYGTRISLQPLGSFDTAAEFNERGQLKNCTYPGIAYIGDERTGSYFRVLVELSGTVRVEQYRGGAWR